MMTTEECSKVYPGGKNDPAFYFGGYRFHYGGYSIMVHCNKGMYYTNDFPASFRDSLPNGYNPIIEMPRHTAETVFRKCITWYKEQKKTVN